MRDQTTRKEGRPTGRGRARRLFRAWFLPFPHRIAENGREFASRKRNKTGHPLIAFMIAFGRYSGYKLSELFRFKAFWQAKER